MCLLDVKAFSLTRPFRMLIRMLIIATIISCRSASPGLMCLLWAQFYECLGLSSRSLTEAMNTPPLREAFCSYITTQTRCPESEEEQTNVRGMSEDYHTLNSLGCTMQDFYIKVVLIGIGVNLRWSVNQRGGLKESNLYKLSVIWK